MELKDRLERFAKVMGWKVTEQPWLAEALLGGLAAREKKYGVPICPCVFFDPTEGTHRETITNHTCPCSDALPAIQTNGRCHCGLFEKGE